MLELVFLPPELKARPDLFQLNVLPTIHLLEVVVPERDEVVVVGKCDDPLAVLLQQFHESPFPLILKTKKYLWNRKEILENAHTAFPQSCLEIVENQVWRCFTYFANVWDVVPG